MQIRYCLIVTSGTGETRRVRVGDAPVTVGRVSSAMISIDETAVSRKHCVVTPSGGGLTLIDQGSTNGTFVNGIRRQHARLVHNDEIRVGTAHIRVQAESSRDLGSVASDAPETLAPGLNCPLQPSQQLTVVVDLARRLSMTGSPLGAMQVVLEAVSDGFPVERSLIALGKPLWRDGALRVIASRVKATGKEAVDWDIDEAVVKRVVATGQAEARSPADTGAGGQTAKAVRTIVLCAPLRRSDTVMGVLYSEIRPQTTWAATEEVVSLYTAVADVASLHLGSTIPDEVEDVLDQDEQPAASTKHDTIPALPPTRLKELEEARIEIAEKLVQLEHLYQARATMSRGLVHDIKNLVGALHSNHSFIRQSLVAGSDEIEAMDDAEEIARRIVSMAEDVLSVSQMEEGKLPLATQVVSAFDLLGRALRRHTAHSREHGVELVLGPVEEGLKVIVDPKIFDRVIDNLVGNAIRHAGKNGRVLLSGRWSSDQAEFLVADSGPGVPPAERQRIFNEWYHAGASSARHHGIGLYFCRMAAEAHGGGIRVEGTPGDCRFVVSVPMSDDYETDELTVVQLSPAANLKLLKSTIRE